MSTTLRRQSWFVCLMAFVMGWSSFVYASSMPMHAKMLQQQSSAVQQPSTQNVAEHPQHQTLSQAQPDCHAAAPMQHSQHLAQMDLQKPCDSHSSSSTPVKQCADCAQLHCQTLSVWLDTAVADPLLHFSSDPATNLHGRYTAQHLIGYWQEILRPPKA